MGIENEGSEKGTGNRERNELRMRAVKGEQGTE